MNEEIIKFAKENVWTLREIANKFNIPEKNIRTLRRRLQELNIKFKDGRGRKRIEL